MRYDCTFVATAESCAAQATTSGGNCAWASGCSGTPNDCSSYGLQSICEPAGCQWVACEGINFYGDSDGDGYGDISNTTAACTAPPGYVERIDCNDADANINAETTFYADTDGDEFGNIANTKAECMQPQGYVNDSADCDDKNKIINPNAIEICDDVDNNCNNNIDEEVKLTFYADLDSDGFGNIGNKTELCAVTAGFTMDSSDCDDKNNTINTDATEICNAVDDNCADGIDEGFDVDGDGFFNATSCANATAYAAKLDIADNNNKIYPGAKEVCDGIDNDANSRIDDVGGKTSENETKCACTGKTESQVTDIKQTKERLNGEDDNCDGRLASEEADADTDGIAVYQGDCDDYNYNVNPKAAESCVNKIDDNCNGKVDDVAEGCTAPKQNPAVAVVNPTPRTQQPAQQTQATSVSDEIFKGEQASAAAAASAKQAEAKAAELSAVEEDNATGGFSPWLLLIGLVPLAIILAYIFYIKPRGGFGALVGKKKDEFAEEFPSAEEAKPDNINSYIASTSAQGYPKEEIRKALLDEGWTEDAIEEALRKQGL